MPDAVPDLGPDVLPGPSGSSPRAPGGISSLTVITGGGSGSHRLLVASDALLARVAALAHLRAVLMVSAGDLFGILEGLDDAAPAGERATVTTMIDEARRIGEEALRALRAAENRAAALHDGILRSVRSYDHADAVATAVLHSIDEQAAWGIGALVRLFAIPIGVAALETLALSAVVFRLSPGELAAHAQSFLKLHGRILTNPFTVGAVREVASDADGFEAGFVGLPPELEELLTGTRVSGVPSAAAVVVGAGNILGLLRETPVTVRKTSSFEFGAPPTSLVDRANSFPDPHDDPNGEQIRIDRYSVPGQPDRFDVFVSGTVTFDPKTGTQPFDFASDLTGVANESPGSLRAVEDAMARAGVTGSSPVVLNGYSQGGLVASMVAASGNYNVKGVVTFGAPSSQVHIPASIPVLSVRNTEDLVPATSGYDVNPNAVIVERTLFAHSPVPSDAAVPAHRLDYYQATAAIVDRAGSPQVRAVLDPLNSFGSGSTHVDSTLWVATRTSDASSAASPAVSASAGSVPPGGEG